VQILLTKRPTTVDLKKLQSALSFTTGFCNNPRTTLYPIKKLTSFRCLVVCFCISVFHSLPSFFVRFVCLFFVPHLAVMERQSLFLHTRQLGRSFQALMACMQIQTPPNKSLFTHTPAWKINFQALMACMQKQGPTPQTKNETQKKKKTNFFQREFFFSTERKNKKQDTKTCVGDLIPQHKELQFYFRTRFLPRVVFVRLNL